VSLLEAASNLSHPQVLMLNGTRGEFSRTEDTYLFFEAIPGRRKRLMFGDGELEVCADTEHRSHRGSPVTERVARLWW
jgi:hypothetical protein